MKFILNESEKFILTEGEDDNLDISAGITVDQPVNTVQGDNGKFNDYGDALKNAKTTEAANQIIDQYIRDEWPNYQKLIKSLGPGFTQELTYLGFTKEENPFLEFLHWNSDTPLKSFNLTSQTYGTLHNAYVDNILTKKDLRGKGIAAYNNIIYCADLYTKPVKEMEEYLELQHKCKITDDIASIFYTGDTLGEQTQDRKLKTLTEIRGQLSADEEKVKFNINNIDSDELKDLSVLKSLIKNMERLAILNQQEAQAKNILAVANSKPKFKETPITQESELKSLRILSRFDIKDFAKGIEDLLNKWPEAK